MVKAATKAAKATKKAAPVEDDDETTSGRKGLEIDPKLARKVAKMRDDGEGWAEITEELDISSGKAMLLNMWARVDEDDRISGTPAAVAKAVVRERKAGYSWGALMARTGIGEARLRKMFEEQTGESTKGNRIGKGGRYPAGQGPNDNGAAPKKAAAAKKVAKATKATKKVAKAGKAAGASKPRSDHPLVDMSLDQLKQRLEGKKINVNRDGDRTEAIRVKKITKKTKDGELEFIDDKAKTRVVLLVQIASASK